MNYKYIFLLVFLQSFVIFAQFNTSKLNFCPSKVYDIFSNENPICIINNGSDVNKLADMIGNQTLVISDNDYKKYNLSSFNIICIGNSLNNKFIKTLSLPYNLNNNKITIGDTIISIGNNNFMAVFYNPYNISNRLLQINKIDNYLNNRFFDNAQFVFFKKDSVVTKGFYYKYYNMKKPPNKNKYLSEKYLNTNLYKFPNLNIDNVKIDTTLIKKLTKKSIAENVKSIINKKVILLGENHNYKTIKDIEKEYVFELNKQSYYPYIVLEQAFSDAKIINYFLSIKSNKEASDFFLKNLDVIASTKEDSSFLNDLRLWNISYPNKKLKVMCTDIEHNYMHTIKDILLPNLKSYGVNINDTIFKEWQFQENEALLKKIKNENPNISSYEKLIIDNLIITMKAYKSVYSKGFRAFSKIRLKSIINKYDNYYSNIIKNNKFIVIGGSNHVETKNINNVDKNAEGYYLEYLNKYTKGNTYSIRLIAFSYNIDYSLINKKDLKFKQSNYRKAIKTYSENIKQGYINKNDSIFNFSKYNSLIKQLLEYSVIINKPYFFKTVNVDYVYKPYYISFEDLKSSNYFKNDFKTFDEVIIINFSPFIVSR